jgi:uncharacterized protein YqeY
MSTLLNKIKQNQFNARISRASAIAQFLTTLYSEAANVGLNDGKRESTDAEVIAVIRKFIKNAGEIISAAPNTEAASFAQSEINLLEEYLPKQLTPEEMKAVIDTIEVKTVPNIMSYFKENHAGKFCGKILSTLAKAL